MRFSYLLAIALTLPSAHVTLHAETSGEKQIVEAHSLWAAGHPRAAMKLLEPLLRSDVRVFTARELGVALGVLALSYQDLEMYGKARQAYQSAIEVLRTDPSAQAQFAATIDNLATLEESLGQMDSARALCMRALHIYEGLGDHSGIAIASTDLAVIAYGEKDYRAARRFVGKAFAETRATASVGDDNLAAMDSVKAALDLHDGRNQEAISAAQEAIDYWTRTRGPKYFMLGTSYLLMAQARAKSRDYASGLGDAQHAMAIAAEAIGDNSSAYFTAEGVYADILRATGSRQEAGRLKREARSALEQLQKQQCGGCTIDANGFR